MTHEQGHHGKSNEWFTPPEITTALGPFDLDPCTAKTPPFPIARTWISEPDDGLATSWSGFVWCNPPYGPHTGKWLAKMAEHNNGIALVAARTETRYFHEFVWPKAAGVLFLKGRLRFYDVNGVKGPMACAHPSMLIAYGMHAWSRLVQHRELGSVVACGLGF